MIDIDDRDPSEAWARMIEQLEFEEEFRRDEAMLKQLKEEANEQK